MAHSALRQRFVIVVAWALCLLLVGLVPPTRVRAAQSTTLSPNSGPPGTVVRATGSGWPAGDRIAVWWSDGTPLTQTTADANGSFQVSFTVPSNATPGPNDLEIKDIEPGQAGIDDFPTFTVTSLSLPSRPILEVPRPGTQLPVGEPILFSWSTDGDASYLEVWSISPVVGPPESPGWQSGTTWTSLPASNVGFTYGWHVKCICQSET